MQATLRSEGKNSMSQAQYDSFVDAFNQGALLKPEQPGSVIADFVAEPSKELSGRCLSYVSHSAGWHQYTNQTVVGTHKSWPRTGSNDGSEVYLWVRGC